MFEVEDPYEQAQYRPPNIQAQVNRGMGALGKLQGSGGNQRGSQLYYNLGWLVYAVVLICTFGTVKLVKFLNALSDQKAMASPKWQQMLDEVERENNRPPSPAPWRASRGPGPVSFGEDREPEERQMAHDSDHLIDELPGDALMLALRRDEYWEYRLFGRVLEEELDRRAPLRREVGHRRAQTDEATYVGLADFGQWGLDRLSEFSEFVDTVVAIFNDDLPQALGDEGVPGDPLEIVAVARQLAQLWEDLAEWTFRCRSVRVDPTAQRAVDLLSNANAHMLDEIWDFGHRFIPRLEEAIKKHADDDAELVVVTMALTLTADLDEFSEELSRLGRGLAS